MRLNRSKSLISFKTFTSFLQEINPTQQLILRTEHGGKIQEFDVEF